MRREIGEADRSPVDAYRSAGPEVRDCCVSRHCSFETLGLIVPVEQKDQLSSELPQAADPEVAVKDCGAAGRRAELPQHFQAGGSHAGQIVAREQHPAARIDRGGMEVELVIRERAAEKDNVRIVPPQSPVLPARNSESLCPRTPLCARVWLPISKPILSSARICSHVM